MFDSSVAVAMFSDEAFKLLFRSEVTLEHHEAPLSDELAMAKTFVPVLALVSALALPTIASASSNGPLTREQVRAELVQLQQAGYDRNDSDVHYPAHIQAALKSVAAQQQALSGHGGVKSGSAASGAPTQWASDHSIYRGS